MTSFCLEVTEIGDEMYSLCHFKWSESVTAIQLHLERLLKMTLNVPNVKRSPFMKGNMSKNNFLS